MRKVYDDDHSKIHLDLDLHSNPRRHRVTKHESFIKCIIEINNYCLNIQPFSTLRKNKNKNIPPLGSQVAFHVNKTKLQRHQKLVLLQITTLQWRSQRPVPQSFNQTDY